MKVLEKILKIIILLFNEFNNLISKIFNKLPRVIKVAIIYELVLLASLNFLPNNNVEKIVEKVEKVVVTEIVEITETIEKEQIAIVEKPASKCNLDNEIACKIYTKGIESGLTHDQATLVVSISAHETGYWKSKAFTKNNNFGGLMSAKTGKLKHYNSFDEGLNALVKCLKTYYFDKGLNTIEKIGSKYCPVGAKNDPNNLNQYWVGGVTKIYNTYLQK